MTSCQPVRRTHPPSLVVQESAPVDAVALCLSPPGMYAAIPTRVYQLTGNALA